MIRLRTLGAVDLTAQQGQRVGSLLQQPKRLGLLVYLAAQDGAPVPRDRILALFWPDSDRDHARHALSQALYYLRRSLGRQVLASSGPEEVGLSPGAAWCDIVEFRRALSQGEDSRAMELYQGDFLDGFHVSGLSELEHWIERERSRLKEMAADAATRLMEERGLVGDPAGAVRWAERALDLVPYDETRLRHLVSLLWESGDRARAMLAYETFSRTLRDQLDVDPSPETQALVRRIAESAQEAAPLQPEGPGAPAAARTSVAAPGDQGDPGEAPASGGLEERGVPGPPHSVGSAARGDSRSREGSRLQALARPAAAVAFSAILIVVAVFAGIRRSNATPETAVPPAPGRVAVLPFAFHGSPAYAYLGDAVSELLQIAVSGLGGLQGVDPRALSASLDPADPNGLDPRTGSALARRFGADYFVLGSVLEAGGRVQITAYIYQGGELKGALQERLEDETRLFDVVDDLVRGMVASEFLPARTRLGQVAAMTTHSLPALKAFLEGERAFRAGQFLPASDAFREAVERDSTFALAHYRRSVAALWTGGEEFDGPRQWIEAAIRHSQGLSQQDRLLVEALRAFLLGSLTEGDRLYRAILAERPENAEAWFQLGELYFHYGALAGWPLGTSREPFERVLAQDPDNRESLTHLAAVAAAEGRTADLDSLVDRVARLTANGEAPLHLLAMRTFASRGPEAREELLERARQATPSQLRTAVSYVARFLGDLEAAESLASVLTAADQPEPIRAEGHLILAHLRLGRGQLRGARAELEAAMRIEPVQAAHTAAGFELLPFLPEEAVPQILVQHNRSSRASEADRPPLALYFDGLRRARAGEADAALGIADELLRLARAPSGRALPLTTSLAHAVRAEARIQADRLEEALRELERVTESAERWYELQRVSNLYTLSRERYLRAELLHRLGRSQEALPWYESLTQSSLGEIPYLAPSHLRRAEILASIGRNGEAAASYERFQALWGESDPELRLELAKADSDAGLPQPPRRR